MKLWSRGTPAGLDRPIIGRVCRGDCGQAGHTDCVRIATPDAPATSRGDGAWLGLAGERQEGLQGARGIFGVCGLEYLRGGDVVRLAPDGHVSVLYRRESMFNAILVTEQCNSYCVMCSQPPRQRDDRARFRELWRLVDLIDPETEELGITGGEPTTFGLEFVEFVAHCCSRLPATRLHVLTNGRSFRDKRLVRALQSTGHPGLMLGIPLYSDDEARHDFVVQASGAYGETLEGLLNLGEAGIPIELRNVLHRHTVDRLIPFSEFVVRNLTFCSQVALMGLEPYGFGRSNFSDLWVDPVDYGPRLRRAVEVLERGSMRPLIYNHQLCVLDPELWRYAVRAISDWKNQYLEACASCAAREVCGGFFQSSMRRHSRGISPIVSDGEKVGQGSGAISDPTRGGEAACESRG